MSYSFGHFAIYPRKWRKIELIVSLLPEPFEFQHSLLGECSYHFCIHRINSPDLRLVRLHLAFSPDLKLSAAKRMTRYGPSNFILVRGLKK